MLPLIKKCYFGKFAPFIICYYWKEGIFMKQRFLKVLGVYALLLLLLFLYYYLATYFHFQIPCLFRYITGYYCPCCGITRCLFAILQLQFYQAFRYNALIFLLLPVFGFFIIWNSYHYVLGKKNFYSIPNCVYIFLVISFILFGIARNMDMFSYFRPTFISG